MKNSHRFGVERIREAVDYIESMLEMMEINSAWWWQTPLEKFDGLEPAQVGFDRLTEYVEDMLIDYAFEKSGYTISEEGELTPIFRKKAFFTFK